MDDARSAVRAVPLARRGGGGLILWAAASPQAGSRRRGGGMRLPGAREGHVAVGALPVDPAASRGAIGGGSLRLQMVRYGVKPGRVVQITSEHSGWLFR